MVVGYLWWKEASGSKKYIILTSYLKPIHFLRQYNYVLGNPNKMTISNFLVMQLCWYYPLLQVSILLKINRFEFLIVPFSQSLKILESHPKDSVSLSTQKATHKRHNVRIHFHQGFIGNSLSTEVSKNIRKKKLKIIVLSVHSKIKSLTSI